MLRFIFSSMQIHTQREILITASDRERQYDCVWIGCRVIKKAKKKPYILAFVIVMYIVVFQGNFCPFFSIRFVSKCVHTRKKISFQIWCLSQLWCGCNVKAHVQMYTSDDCVDSILVNDCPFLCAYCTYFVSVYKCWYPQSFRVRL